MQMDSTFASFTRQKFQWLIEFEHSLAIRPVDIYRVAKTVVLYICVHHEMLSDPRILFA